MGERKHLAISHKSQSYLPTRRLWVGTVLPWTCKLLGSLAYIVLLTPVEVDDETTILLPDLFKIHDYGCLTYESQPALTNGPGKNDQACCGNHAFWHCKQKAFLSFIIPKDGYIEPDMLEKFCVSLVADERFFTSILSYDRMCNDGMLAC